MRHREVGRRGKTYGASTMARSPESEEPLLHSAPRSPLYSLSFLLVDLDVASFEGFLPRVVAVAQADAIGVGPSGLVQVLHVDPVVERARTIDRRLADDARLGLVGAARH